MSAWYDEPSGRWLPCPDIDDDEQTVMIDDVEAYRRLTLSGGQGAYYELCKQSRRAWELRRRRLA